MQFFQFSCLKKSHQIFKSIEIYALILSFPNCLKSFEKDLSDTKFVVQTLLFFKTKNFDFQNVTE